MKALNPKDNWKRATSRPDRPPGGKERKQRQPEKHSLADPEEEPGREEPAAPPDDFVHDDDADSIFAPDPQVPLSAPDPPPPSPPAPHARAPKKPDGAELPPRHQGMGRWFMGLALCLLGSGYIAYQVLSETVFPGNAPAAVDGGVAGKPPQAARNGEPIHKQPQAAAASSPPPKSGTPLRPAVNPEQIAAAVEAVVAEPSPPHAPPAPVFAAEAPAIPDQDEVSATGTIAAAGEDPASARIVAPAAELKVIRDCEQCPELVVVPAGKFLMGSSVAEPGHHQHEAPQHEVAIAAAFAIGRFEVTFAEWDLCVREGGCRHQAHDEGWGRLRMPAINVSWQDITEEFLPWLARKSGKPYRLPSEAEWEYAVRAGPGLVRTAAYGAAGDAGVVCGSANGADGAGTSGKGVGCRDGFANTAPVGSFKPNAWGLHDLAGNVWEWVEDCWNETYTAAPADGSAWTSGDCDLHVVRGGSWSSDAEKLRAADRGWNRPDGRSPSIGFRVAREP